MGAHGHGGLKDLIFGTTISPVRHHLDVPMLIVRPGKGLKAAWPRHCAAWDRLSQSCVRGEQANPRCERINSSGINEINWHDSCS